jgi:predicted MFS family arabinose efflux permease
VAVIFCLNGLTVGALPVVVQSGINRRVASSRQRATILSVESAISRASYGLAALAVGSLLDSTTLTVALLATLAIGCLPLMLGALDARLTARRS